MSKDESMVSLSRLELIANTQELSSSMEVSICLNILITGIFKGAKFLKPKGILNVHEVNHVSRAFLCKEMEEKPQLNIAQQGFFRCAGLNSIFTLLFHKIMC